MAFRIFVILIFTSICAGAFHSENDDVPNNIADSVGDSLHWTVNEFLAATEAMPDSNYGFIPSDGNFEGVRSLGEQVKHVACTNFAFFNEIEGKTPPEHGEKGGPQSAKSKAELLKYLRDSFAYGDGVLASINCQKCSRSSRRTLRGPSTKLGLAVAAVWHISDHYGQIVEYLRMNGIVPPSTQKYALRVR